jgi:putative transposase
VIQVNDKRRWLYAAVDPDANEILHARFFPSTNAGLTIVFLRELRQKHDLNETTILVDHAQHLTTVLARLRLRFQTLRHGTRNSVERIFREVKRRK